VVVNLGAVPLTPYATPGTPELEAAIADTVAGHDAFLLANHGAVTLGASVEQAEDRMETLEHFARIALVARLLGGGRILTRDAVAGLEAARRASGSTLPITCAPAPTAGEPLPPDLAGVVAQVVRELLGPGR
jgi:L-fuculose-phosphate aldolase